MAATVETIFSNFRGILLIFWYCHTDALTLKSMSPILNLSWARTHAWRRPSQWSPAYVFFPIYLSYFYHPCPILGLISWPDILSSLLTLYNLLDCVPHLGLQWSGCYGLEHLLNFYHSPLPMVGTLLQLPVDFSFPGLLPSIFQGEWQGRGIRQAKFWQVCYSSLSSKIYDQNFMIGTQWTFELMVNFVWGRNCSQNFLNSNPYFELLCVGTDKTVLFHVLTSLSVKLTLRTAIYLKSGYLDQLLFVKSYTRIEKAPMCLKWWFSPVSFEWIPGNLDGILACHVHMCPMHRMFIY